jgi:hypothetical protein
MPMTLLSWCVVVSTIANVLIATMLGWFLLATPSVRITGDVSVHGGVRVNGGTIEVTPSPDRREILKVQICEETSELSPFNLPPQNKPEMIPVTHCASIDEVSRYGIKSYGLSIVPAGH